LLTVDARPLLGLLVGLLAAWAALVALLWVLRPRDARLSELLRVIPDVARLVRDLLSDRRVPLTVRLALVGLLAWLLNPIDLIPEFIPVLGPLDDVVVAIIVLRYVRRRLGDDELRRRWRGTEDGLWLVYAVL
jgi:uncharacterized membrane protein YkvA (DUF1232 family)